MTRVESLFAVVVIACLVFCSLTWFDNRDLRKELATRECVSPRSHRMLLETCEVISRVNRQQEDVIQRAQEAVGIRHDQVRRATRDTRSEKDRGLGGGS